MVADERLHHLHRLSKVDGGQVDGLGVATLGHRALLEGDRQAEFAAPPVEDGLLGIEGFPARGVIGGEQLPAVSSVLADPVVGCGLVGDADLGGAEGAMGDEVDDGGFTDLETRLPAVPAAAAPTLDGRVAGAHGLPALCAAALPLRVRPGVRRKPGTRQQVIIPTTSKGPERSPRGIGRRLSRRSSTCSPTSEA